MSSPLLGRHVGLPSGTPGLLRCSGSLTSLVGSQPKWTWIRISAPGQPYDFREVLMPPKPRSPSWSDGIGTLSARLESSSLPQRRGPENSPFQSFCLAELPTAAIRVYFN